VPRKCRFTSLDNAVVSADDPAYTTLDFGACDAENEVVTSEESDSVRATPRRYRVLVLAWYLGAAVVAIACGRFAHSPWPAAGFLFGALELATFFAGATADDWTRDFRGDYAIWLRGTLANAAVVAIFVAAGAAMPGGRL
jgi:hypothetical protein